MASRRVSRLNEQLRREISDIIAVRLRDPRVGSATITAVEVSGDLSVAKIWVRPGPMVESCEDTLEGLDSATSFIRRELGERIRVQKIPELRFREDRSLEHAARIEEVLSEINDEDESATPEGE